MSELRSDRDVRDFIDGGWRLWDVIDADLAEGRIDEAGWYRAVQSVLVPAYLNAPTPQAQSGHSGDASSWEQGRGFIVEGIDRDGTLLDVGCANGYLMETVHVWAAGSGHHVEPYGLDLSPELVELSKKRLPDWNGRFWTGNALHWEPPFLFDFVHLQQLEYVPVNRRRQLVDHLLNRVCKAQGRLLIGPFNELAVRTATQAALEGWGFKIAGSVQRRHRHPEVVRRLIWIDADAR